MANKIKAHTYSGRGKYAACGSIVVPTGTAAPHAVTPNSVIDVPTWCVDLPWGYWWFYRDDSCLKQELQINVWDVSTGDLVGQLFMISVHHEFTSSTVLNYLHNLGIQKEDAASWGLVDAALVSAGTRCTGFCSVTGGDGFPTQPVDVGPNTGDWLLRGDVNGPNEVAAAQEEYGITVTSPEWDSPVVFAGTTEPIRCDNVVPGAVWPGCIFPNYVSTVIYGAEYPEFAHHVSDAQASGLPGAYPGSGMPNTTPLTRLTDPVQQDKNRTTACKDSYTRPPGKSCDEYPFASAKEGAFTGGGSGRTFPWCQIPQLPAATGPTGYSACMIDDTQNGLAGTDLETFYVDNRLLDGDNFWVWITS